MTPHAQPIFHCSLQCFWLLRKGTCPWDPVSSACSGAACHADQYLVIGLGRKCMLCISPSACFGRSLLDFIAPLRLCSYSSTEEYYRDGSSQQYIPHISTPSLFLVAEDDPFLGQVPVEECSANPNTILAVTARWVAPAHLLHLCQCLCASYRHNAPITWATEMIGL